jgi:hypothetical protein
MLAQKQPPEHDVVIVTTGDNNDTHYSIPITAQSNIDPIPRHEDSNATLRPYIAPREKNRVHFQQLDPMFDNRHQRTPPAREERQQYNDNFPSRTPVRNSQDYRSSNPVLDSEQEQFNDSQSDTTSIQSAQEQRQENEDLRKRRREFDRILDRSEKDLMGPTRKSIADGRQTYEGKYRD